VKNMQYNSYYILSEQFGRCGLAMGRYHNPQNVVLVEV